MTDARTVIQQLVDELEDHGTTFDDNPPHLYCNSGCGGESKRGPYGCTFTHAPDCSYEKAMKDAREWLAASPADAHNVERLTKLGVALAAVGPGATPEVLASLCEVAGLRVEFFNGMTHEQAKTQIVIAAKGAGLL